MSKAQKFGYEIIGPVVFEYVSWIIDIAKREKINRLYFCARDGYLLQKVAKEICKKQRLKIDCRYLYCSRYSLRMPSYWFLGQEAYDLLLDRLDFVSLYSLLKRLNLSDIEMKEVCKEIEEKDLYTTLDEKSYNRISEKIKKSKLYFEFMMKKSKRAYPDTILYLKQEGLLDDIDRIVLVDSGWAGSMQRSLRQLLEKSLLDDGNMKKVVRITGFYFGMFASPLDDKDGVYKTYYFDVFHHHIRKTLFDNKIFECILSAPHGMTVGYKRKENSIEPILKEDIYSEKQRNVIDEQIKGTMEYVISRKYYEEYDLKKSIYLVYKILNPMMTKPNREIRTHFKYFNFCNDISEEYVDLVLDKKYRNKIRNYMFIYRLWDKIFKRTSKIENIVWPYGLVMSLHYPYKFWAWWNVYCYKYINYIRVARKERKKLGRNFTKN